LPIGHCQGNGDYLLSGLLPAKGRSDFAELFAPAGPPKTDKNTLYLVALTVPSHGIMLEARRQGFNLAQALVLGHILFWWTKKGGKARDGEKWVWKTAQKIADSAGLSLRTTQRALAEMYKDGVLDHRIETAPGGGTRSLIRPLEPALAILKGDSARVSKGPAAPQGGQDGLVGNVDLAEPEPQKWQNGKCQNGGSNQQMDSQKDGQTDVEQSISAEDQAPPAELEATDTPLPAPEEAEEENELEKAEWAVVESTPSPAEQMVEKPAARLAAALASRGLPGLSLKFESDAEHLYAFSVAVQQSGWPFHAFIGAMLDRWQRLLPALPQVVAEYEGNQQRPTFQALAYNRRRLLQSTGYLVAADKFHGVLEHELAKANKVPVLHDATDGLVKAAAEFVAMYSLMNGPPAKLMVPKGLREALEWPGDPIGFRYTPVESSTIAIAAAHTDFAEWMTKRASEFLPTYKQRGAAAKKWLALREELSFSPHDQKLKKAVSAAWAVTESWPTSEQQHERCVRVWQAYLEATQWAAYPKGGKPAALPCWSEPSGVDETEISDAEAFVAFA